LDQSFSTVSVTYVTIVRGEREMARPGARGSRKRGYRTSQTSVACNASGIFVAVHRGLNAVAPAPICGQQIGKKGT